MIPVGHVYHLERGRLDVRSVLSATILGVATALLVAGLVWLWEVSPVPTLLVITPLAQGAAIGTILAWVVGRLRLRLPRLLWTLGFACGLLSVGMVHYVHYLRFLDEVNAAYRAQIEGRDEIPEDKKQEMRDRLADGTMNPGQLVLRMNTGREGWLGFMALRAQDGFQIRRAHIDGAGVWTVWGIEALIVGFVASSLTRTRSSEPLCGDCGDWCVKRRAPVELLSGAAPELADAVLADDLDRAAEVLSGPVDAERQRRDATRATLHACPRCGQAFVDVEGYTIEFDGQTTRTTTLSYLKLVRVSPEMADLLRNPPPPAAGGDDPALAAEGGDPGPPEAEGA